MNKFAFASAIALIAGFGAAGAHAADLIIEDSYVSESSTSFTGFYLEVYGGATLAVDSSYDGVDYPMDWGPAVGVALGMQTPVEGLAVELDLMYAGAEYSDYDYGVYNTALMANAVYTVPLNDTFELYGQAGLGIVNVTYADDYSGLGAGFNVAAGARMELTEGVKAFTELKYTSTFSDVDADGQDIGYPLATALVGLRFEF